MSTDLYGVRILDIDEDKSMVKMRVFVVYYDTGYEYHQPIPEDRSFFVRVLSDVGAFGEDMDEVQRFEEEYINSTAFRFIDRFVELERRNFPVTSYKEYADFYYERGGTWEDEDKLVQADYEVYVTKPAYLNALTVGESWGTTSYQTESDPLLLRDYLHVPDFNDSRSFVPFGDLESEETVVSQLHFSLDGSKLLATNNEGGWRVFSTKDFSTIAEHLDDGDWSADAGWTPNGHIGYKQGDQWMEMNLETKESQPIEHFGIQSSDDGAYYIQNAIYDDDTDANAEKGTATIHNANGEVVYSFLIEWELMVYAGFAPGTPHAIISIECEDTWYLNLDSQDTQPLPSIGNARPQSFGMSPDGTYTIASTYDMGTIVFESQSGRIIRQLQPNNHRIPTACAWSANGSLVATSTCNGSGYQSVIELHRTGQAIEDEAKQPLSPPEATHNDITDLARLYVQQTTSFGAGWSSHLDNDLMDMHLAMVKMGHKRADLIEHMHTDTTKIATRAYESILAHQQGNSKRATEALKDALQRIERAEEDDWNPTFRYAPLAAAQHLAGQREAAEASWEKALIKADDEANGFQKRAILTRALIYMGRLSEVEDIIKQEEPGGWISDFHKRLFADLIEAQVFGLLATACQTWKVSEDWGTPTEIQGMLIERHAPEKAISMDWLGCETDDELTEEAWQTWHKQHPSDALQALAKRRTEHPEEAEAWDAIQALLDAGEQQDSPTTPPTNDEERFARACQRGNWAKVYDTISQTPPAQRHDLWQTAAFSALSRNELYIALDALPRIPCKDMNSMGLRALQKAFNSLAGKHSCHYHP